MLRFFGGYHALPGGVRAPHDLSAVDGDDERSLRLCAVRELFEETGVLLTEGIRPDPERRALLRADLLRENGDAEDAASRAAAFLQETGALRAADRLTTICRITTPAFSPVRYDTLFCIAELPAGEEPQVETGELVGGGFVKPKDALMAWRRGDMLIVPPVVILLQLLEQGDLDHFMAEAARIARSYQDGELHRVQFTPGVVMASVRSPTLPPATTTNCLIVGNERLWVVDPGTHEPDEQERLIRLLDVLCQEGRVVAGVLLTHHHVDHVGAVRRLSNHYQVPVRAHPLTLKRLEPGFLVGEPLLDGTAIDLGTAPDGSADWTLTAVFTPGHDRGHHCFRESRYQAVLVGDMLSTVSTIVIDPPEGHMATYLRSLERLLSEPMGTLYPAHGPAARDGHNLIRQYLRHRLTREANLLKTLQDSPGTLDALLTKVYWDVDPRMHGIAIRSLLAGLEKLLEEGRVVERDGIWKIAPGGGPIGKD